MKATYIQPDTKSVIIKATVLLNASPTGVSNGGKVHDVFSSSDTSYSRGNRSWNEEDDF